ncbi:MAG: tetratricopeptide repeat protein [Gammaproteobacteria bacterium]
MREFESLKQRNSAASRVFGLLTLFGILPLICSLPACSNHAHQPTTEKESPISAFSGTQPVKGIGNPGYSSSPMNARNNVALHDDSSAFLSVRKAAEQDSPEAQLYLGNAYSVGQGVPQDYVKGFEWIQKAAEQGLVQAQSELGAMFYNGDGIPQDYTKAFKWSEKAAKHGSLWAKHNLALMYAKGAGVPQDYVQAYAWYNIAAAQDYKLAATYRDLIGRSFDHRALNRAQSLAREYFEKYVLPFR